MTKIHAWGKDHKNSPGRRLPKIQGDSEGLRVDNTLILDFWYEKTFLSFKLLGLWHFVTASMLASCSLSWYNTWFKHVEGGKTYLTVRASWQSGRDNRDDHHMAARKQRAFSNFSGPGLSFQGVPAWCTSSRWGPISVFRHLLIMSSCYGSMEIFSPWLGQNCQGWIISASKQTLNTWTVPSENNNRQENEYDN